MKRRIFLFLVSLFVISAFTGCSVAKENDKVVINETKTKWELFAPPVVVPISDDTDFWLYPKSDDSKEAEDQPLFQGSGYNGSCSFSFNHTTGEWDSLFDVDLEQDAKLTGAIYDSENNCFYLKYFSALKDEETGCGECFIQKVSDNGTLAWTSNIGKYKFMAMVLDKKTKDLLVLGNYGTASDLLFLDRNTGTVSKKGIHGSVQRKVATNQNGIYGYLTNYDRSNTTISQFDWDGTVVWTNDLEGCNYDSIAATDDYVFLSSEIYPYILQLDADTGTLEKKIPLPNLGFQTFYIDCVVVGDQLFTACTARPGASTNCGLIQYDIENGEKPFFVEKANGFSCTVIKEYNGKGKAFFRSTETDEMIIYTISPIEKEN